MAHRQEVAGSQTWSALGSFASVLAAVCLPAAVWNFISLARADLVFPAHALTCSACFFTYGLPDVSVVGSTTSGLLKCRSFTILPMQNCSSDPCILVWTMEPCDVSIGILCKQEARGATTRVLRGCGTAFLYMQCEKTSDRSHGEARELAPEL